MCSDCFSIAFHSYLPDEVQELRNEEDLLTADIEQMEGRVKGIQVCISDLKHDLHRYKQHIEQVQSDKNALSDDTGLSKEDIEQHGHDLDLMMEEDFNEIKILKREVKAWRKLIDEYRHDILWKDRKLKVVQQKIEDPQYLYPLHPKDAQQTKKITEYFKRDKRKTRKRKRTRVDK